MDRAAAPANELSMSRPDPSASREAPPAPDRVQAPVLRYRDSDGAWIDCHLDGKDQLTLGRHPSCNLALVWDDSVSRTHAILQHFGGTWTIADDGISRNGTFV